ncbi:type II toxin-antitoxin system RelE/ParE family toxin [Actinomycetospora sp. CA-101289]|uniref:type II toxin-antitoxin system RelE/ParE family toxin n=1 Tax=Actinomycetospora sp. CA-101289 TaxID=3239893 RepID=UPI003D992A7A
MAWGSVELEPGVRRWLEDLSARHFGAAAFHIDLLGERGPLLGEPYTRQLSGKLRELRVHLGGEAVRVTYWIASGRRIVLLTVFTKQRMRQSAEVRRAVRAVERCRAEMHVVEDDDG